MLINNIIVYIACHQLTRVSCKILPVSLRSVHAATIHIQYTIALGLILTWTRINVFYCIIHLVILFNIFKLHLRWSYMQLCIWIKELPMFTYNLWMVNCLHPVDTPCQLLYSVINIAMSNNFKHYNVHFTHFFSVTKLDLVIQALLLDYILALGKNTRTPRVHLVLK